MTGRGLGMTGWARERESDLDSLKGIDLVTMSGKRCIGGSLAAQRTYYTGL